MASPVAGEGSKETRCTSAATVTEAWITLWPGRRTQIPLCGRAANPERQSSRLDWRWNCLINSMNCPLCNIALQPAERIGVTIHACPRCGGNWPDQLGFDTLTHPTLLRRRPKYWSLRVALLAGTAVIVCLAATLLIGTVKVWPIARDWALSIVSGSGVNLASQAKEVAARLGYDRVVELARLPEDAAALKAIVARAGFQQLVASVALAPELGVLIQDGSYLKALQEAGRQNVSNVAAVQIDSTRSADVRLAVQKVQSALMAVSSTQGVVGAFEPAVVDLLGSDPFRQLCQSPAFYRIFRLTTTSGKPE